MLQTEVTAVNIGSQLLLTKGQFVPKCILESMSLEMLSNTPWKSVLCPNIYGKHWCKQFNPLLLVQDFSRDLRILRKEINIE